MSVEIVLSRRGLALAEAHDRGREQEPDAITCVGAEPDRATAGIVFIGMVVIIVGLPIYWLVTRGA